jgi:hypothetical protein
LRERSLLETEHSCIALFNCTTMKVASLVICAALIGHCTAFTVGYAATKSSTSLRAMEGDFAGAVAAAVAVAGIGGFFAMKKTSKKTTEAQSKTVDILIDISIPYNAAAVLAYNEWRGDAELDETPFERFEPLYLEKAVAEVSAKKIAREISKVDADLAELKAAGEVKTK